MENFFKGISSKGISPERINPERISASYRAIRRRTNALCEPLSSEDHGLQAMPETSPAKWHLAHTSWFFEQFVLLPYCPGYRPFHPRYEYLFNSYYQAVGPQYPRHQRGLLSRPALAEIQQYRAAVDQRLLDLLQDAAAADGDMLARIELGLHHEQQHQELILTDVKYNLAQNPLCPVYLPPPRAIAATATTPLGWLDYAGGVVEIGAAGGSRADDLRRDNFSVDDFCFDNFCFDNETPRHRVFLEPYALGDRLVTNGEYRDFIRDGGYRRPELWLADGWQAVARHAWEAPLYWRPQGDDYRHYTLHGERELRADEPVVHIGYYEADAFARWARARLPTESEWEHAAGVAPVRGHFNDDGPLHPLPAAAGQSGPRQMFGDAWEWTASAYLPYPGFRPQAAALGEYNAKFMCNQWVLRGGSCASSSGHLRASYRNFFYPWDRWQFTGVRLARSV
jgi:ergothioneine biosynthesis protein EgtB